MILKIKNLGPIKKAKVDMGKSILFFVGYNNSGKTYLSQLIWAIYNENFHSRFAEECDVSNLLAIDDISDFKIDGNMIERLLSDYTNFLKANINLIFKSEKKYFKKFEIKLVLNEDIKELVVKDIEVKFTNALNKDDLITISTGQGKNRLEINSTQETNQENIKRKIIHFLLFGLFKESSFYLPSIRGAYTTFYEYIYKIEKEKKDVLDDFFLSEDRNIRKLLQLANETKPAYTLPMNELISKMVDLKQEDIVNEDFVEFQKKLENLMGGNIEINQLPLGKKELRLHIDDKMNLPMYLSSSNTNQLTTLYLFFRYWAKSNNSNFLILDEPEENLHPKNQYELMNLLIDFATKGNKLLLTTHSVLMAKIINNYITFSMLPKDKQQEINSKYLNADIDKDDIEVCFFDGVQVKNYTIEEYGVLFKDFVEVEQGIEQLSNEINMKLYAVNKS